MLPLPPLPRAFCAAKAALFTHVFFDAHQPHADVLAHSVHVSKDEQSISEHFPFVAIKLLAAQSFDRSYVGDPTVRNISINHWGTIRYCPDLGIHTPASGHQPQLTPGCFVVSRQSPHFVWALHTVAELGPILDCASAIVKRF